MAGTDKPGVTPPAGGTGPEAIQQLLALMSNNQQTSKTTSDVSGLKTVLDQLLQSANTPGADPQALLQSIFQQGASKIPGLVAGTYNASGSRAAPGTMSPKLAELQAQITLAAQQQLAQQQLAQQQLKAQTLGQAGNVAGNIAAGTKSTTANTGNSVTQGLNKLVQLNTLGKAATGYDALGKGKQFLTDLINPTPNYLAGEGFMQASPNVGGLALGGSPSAGLPQVFSQPDFTSAVQAGDGTQLADAVAALTSSGSSAPLIDFSNLFSNPGSNSTASSALDTTSLTAAVPDYTDAGSSLSNFSSGTDGAASSSSSAASSGSSALGSSVQLLRALDFAVNPKKRGDVLDLSDGNWVDDVGDIGDAISLGVPWAGLARPAAQYVDIGMHTAEDFVNNPLETTETVASGDQLTGNLMIDATTQIPQIIDNVGNALNNFGSDIGNVFGW